MCPRPSKLFSQPIDTIALSSTPPLAPTNSLLFLMSHTHPTAASSSSSSSSNFQLIINNALDTYKSRTRNDLRDHPLATQLQACDSPTAILALLQQQVQGQDQSRSTDERRTKWLDPTVNVLSAFSDILEAGVSLVCFGTFTSLRSALLFLCPRHSHLRASFLPESASSFQCVSLLLLPCVGHCNTYVSQTAKDLRASQDTLVAIFDRIENFFQRLEIYTELEPTAGMMNIIIEIMAEVISVLGIATKEIKRGRISKYLLYECVAVD